MKNRKKGFTLIELVVVIAIIGIMAAIATPIVVGNTSDKNRAEDTLKGVYDKAEHIVKGVADEKTIKLDPKISGFTINGKKNSCSNTAFFGENSSTFDEKTQLLYTIAYMMISNNSNYKLANLEYVYYVNDSEASNSKKWTATTVSPFDNSTSDSNDLLKPKFGNSIVELTIEEKTLQGNVPEDPTNPTPPKKVLFAQVKLVGYCGEKAIYFYRFDYKNQLQLFRNGKKTSPSEVIAARKECYSGIE